jgi:hypothetical protein
MPKSSANKVNPKKVKRPKKIIELKSVTLAPELLNNRSPYRNEFVGQARAMCQLGATDFDLADFFEVSWRTIKRWEGMHPDFNAALQRGKEAADDRVERSLYARATGYTFDSEKVFNNEGVITRVPVTEHVPPDVTACIFWLKNRRSSEWRDKTDHEHNHLHALALQGGSMSVEEAQAMFREARSMTPADLHKSFKVIEGKVVKAA